MNNLNYAEDGSDVDEDEDEEEDVGEAPSDPDDTDYGGGRRRNARTERAAVGSIDQQRIGKLRKKKDEMDRGWTWLGDRVPGDKVRSQLVKPTKHQYM